MEDIIIDEYILEVMAALNIIVKYVTNLDIECNISDNNIIEFISKRSLSHDENHGIREKVLNSKYKNWLFFVRFWNDGNTYRYSFVNDLIKEDAAIYMRDKYLKELI